MDPGRIGINLAAPDRLRIHNMCKNLGLDPDPDRHQMENGKSDPDPTVSERCRATQHWSHSSYFVGDKKTSKRISRISLKGRITYVTCY